MNATMAADDPRHGTVSGYKYLGCRCHRCRGASVRYEKGRRWLIHQGLKPTIPAHGFKRRIRALMAIGWTQKEIAAELGIAQGNLALKMRTNDTVRRATHVAAAEVYERLCMTVRTSSMTGRRTAGIARRKGWPPPLAWTDIDDPDEYPTGWEYVPADRAEALAELDAHHVGLTEACRRLDLRRDSLERWCERHGCRDIYERMLRREQPDYERLATGRRAS